VPSYKSSDAVEQERYVQVNVVQTAMPRLMMRETYGVSSLDGRRLGLVSSAKRQTPQSSVSERTPGALTVPATVKCARASPLGGRWGVVRCICGEIPTDRIPGQRLGRCPTAEARL
jgi:hypothetical protein